MEDKIVLAIDVGHGNCKFTTASVADEFKPQMFPSIAPQSRKGTFSTYFEPGKSFEVPIGDAIHIVGEDVEDEALSTTKRIVDANFSLSNTYLALVNGCLSRINKPHVDLLVLGLPLTTYQTHHERLREKMVGGHKIFNPNRAKNPDAPTYSSVEVRAVRVFPQPVGAFFNYTIPRQLLESMQDQLNLVLDVGLGTFDWFLARGQKPIKGRCGANNNGVLSLSTAVAEAIGPNTVNNFGIMNRIDKAIREESSFNLHGKPINVKKYYWTTVENAIQTSVASMMQSVGNSDDIDNIILTGGGAQLFASAIRKAFPHHEIQLESDPIYSVVKGFQMVGEQIVQDIHKR